MPTAKVIKENALCVDNLRHAEYYAMQEVFDNLYARSLKGGTFDDLMDVIFSRENILLAYRNIKTNSGSHTPGTDHVTIKDIGKLTPEDVVDKVRFIVTGSKHGYRPRPVRRKDIPKQRFHQTSWHPMYVGPPDTAMYQTGHGANLRGQIQ